MTFKKTFKLPPLHECLYGTHSCLQALKHSRQNKTMRVFITESTLKSFTDVLQKAQIKPSITSSKQLSEMAQSHTHQGILIIKPTAPLIPLEKLISSLPSTSTLLVIDTIEDGQNLGAICRSCAAFNIQGIILHKEHIPGGSHWKKIASGSLEHIQLCTVSNITQALQTLKKEDFWCIGLDEKGKYTHNLLHERRVAFVLGGEHKGLRPLVKTHCDTLLSIPTTKQFSTLNMSHACSIICAQRFAHLLK